ncbi:MAG: DegQ family serine endoprotease [Smithella sp.]
MKTKVKVLSGAAILIFIGIVFGFIFSADLGIFKVGQAQVTQISKESIDVLEKTNKAMAELAEVAKPSVVNISSQRTVVSQPIPFPFFNDPMFREFFDNGKNKPRKYKQMGLGSGVIVGKEGYVITNNHVVQGSEEILVRLSDKRQFKGKVIGADPLTDLAVVKINAQNLPVIKLGDSDKLKVGERVIAIGIPFGLNQSVTSGIISATGRADVGIVTYEDFIQTDAAINPGNSGGALVNIRGELIGINTAIASSTGGYQGVGFAIPSNMVRLVMNSLIKRGKVVRGWLGVSIQPLTPALARQLGIKGEEGAVISDVTEDSPAQKAGMQQGDVITEFEGKKIKDWAQLRNVVSNVAPGKEVNVKIIRNGVEKNLKVVIKEMPSNLAAKAGAVSNEFKGIHVRNIPAEARKVLGLPARVKGVIITEIEEGSPAEAVLAANDVIMQINKKKIENIEDYKKAISSIKAGEDILLLIYRNGASIYITLSQQ